MNDREKIGGKIAKIRCKRGISQNQLGEMVGISQNHVVRIESGLYDVKFILISKIAKALGCSVDDFLENEE